MKWIVLALLLTSLPAGAQEQSGADGMGPIEQGMRSILDGFITRMEPALDDIGRAVAEMGPMAEALMKMMDNIGNYAMPEIQPNGDILIRRKPAPPGLLKEGEIDL